MRQRRLIPMTDFRHDAELWISQVRGAEDESRRIVSHAVKKFPALYWTRMFITVFTTLATGPCPEPYGSYAHAHALLLYDLLQCCSLPTCIFPSGRATKVRYNVLTSPVRVAFHEHFIFLCLITLLIFCKGQSTDYDTPQCLLFSILYFISLRSKYSPKYSAFKHTQIDSDYVLLG
jgi:hypothetical protein